MKRHGAIPSLKALLPRAADLPATAARATLMNLTAEEAAALWAAVSVL